MSNPLNQGTFRYARPTESRHSCCQNIMRRVKLEKRTYCQHSSVTKITHFHLLMVRPNDVPWTAWSINKYRSYNWRENNQRRCLSHISPTNETWEDIRWLFRKGEPTITEYDMKRSSDYTFMLTESSDVICSHRSDLQNIVPCNQEEGDSGMMVCIADAHSQGYSKVPVCTVDTDVLCKNIFNWRSFG